MKNARYVPGITLPSVMASVFALLVMAILIQYAEIIVGLSYPAEHTLAIPGMVVFLCISLLGGLFYVTVRARLLTRAERLCVMYTILIAAPLMTQGFWHRIVSITATIPRMGDFKKIDAFSDRLWPHGENLVKDGLSHAHRDALALQGNVTWEEVAYEEGRTDRLPVLRNTAPGEVAAVSLTLPLGKDGEPHLVPGEPYLVSVLARAEGLGPDATYYCRVYNESGSAYVEAFRSNAPAEITFLHKTGFVRTGRYNFLLPRDPGSHVTLEFGLSGPGCLALYDPKLFSVGALEFAYKGKMLVSRGEYDRLPEAERTGLIPRPDSLWSLEGARFLLSAYIPVGDWVQPFLTWLAFILVILMATFAVNVIMRKQWMENERYPLPITKIPVALVGLEDPEDGAMPAIWRNRVMWAGFGVSLFWCLMRGWHFYNPQVPDMNVNVALKPYLGDPSWGGMWDNVTFSVTAIFLSLAVFMELNVLLSLTIGFLLFHSQWWVGEVTGMNVNANYPFVNEQQTGAYFTYALLLVFFSRKYLWRVLGQAFARSPEPTGEPLSYRAAFGLLLASLVGMMLWARWIEVSSWGMLCFFIFLLCVCFVAAKFRAECGTPFGYFGPWNAALFLFFLGGIPLFGAGTILVALTASFFLCETVFFLVPGAQVELIELGRRAKIVPRHVFYICLMGILGGMVFGGWVFLSNAYAVGGETVKYSWAFETKWWYFFPFNVEATSATNQYLAEQRAQGQGAAEPPARGPAEAEPAEGGDGAAGDREDAAPAIDPTTYAYAYGAAVTILVTVLRQLFAGFWFHPMGFIVGMTRMMDYVWGSVLVAWFVRLMVLKVGGAATVRNRLQPFFIGVFLGAITSALVFGILGGYLHHLDVGRIYGEIP